MSPDFVTLKITSNIDFSNFVFSNFLISNLVTFSKYLVVWVPPFSSQLHFSKAIKNRSPNKRNARGNKKYQKNSVAKEEEEQ